MSKKLTPAQVSLLRELPTHVVPEYRPGQALVAKGMAEWADETTMMLNPTPAGLAALAQEGGE